MEVAQVTVFIENRSGGLAEIVDVLAQGAVDIKALTLADMADFGILRLIVEDADRTRELLRGAGFTVEKTHVVAVEVPDRPGGLSDTLHALGRSGINIEYMYSAARTTGERAIIIFRVDEIPRAIEALHRAGVKVLEALDNL